MDYDKINGSPFLNNKFLPGKIINKNTLDIQNVYLRYNVYNNFFEVKESDSGDETFSLMKNKFIIPSINQQEFYLTKSIENDENIYVSLVSRLNDNKIILKAYTCEYKEGVIPKSSYDKGRPAKFISNEVYYIAASEDFKLYKEFDLSKRDLLDIFDDKRDALKKFIKQKDLKFKNENDLIILINYYKSI
ncbi:hypothetical protein GCM10009117_26800 [Gangjinia marincola]|uniref:Uncharacterized protein n=1 Tax=Gangjinia marincola TaxID=578463 RepID=A0ABN1MK18_9FLAO